MKYSVFFHSAKQAGRLSTYVRWRVAANQRPNIWKTLFSAAISTIQQSVSATSYDPYPFVVYKSMYTYDMHTPGYLVRTWSTARRAEAYYHMTEAHGVPAVLHLVHCCTRRTTTQTSVLYMRRLEMQQWLRPVPWYPCTYTPDEQGYLVSAGTHAARYGASRALPQWQCTREVYATRCTRAYTLHNARALCDILHSCNSDPKYSLPYSAQLALLHTGTCIPGMFSREFSPLEL